VTPVELRLELLGRLSVLHRLQAGSADFDSLVRSGVDRARLSAFLTQGRRRKAPGARPRPPAETSALVSRLVSSGGVVAGGAALREWLYSDAPGDVDVFFRDFPSYVSAHLEAYGDPRVDVCLYDGSPYELFDLNVSKCALGSDGFDLDPSCEEALRSGVSGISIGAVVDARATLRRVAKYGDRWGLRFDRSHVLTVCSAWAVEDSVALEALKHSS
jgi:hypothetical protein